MSEKFKKLKRKYLLAALLKSAICGLSFGLLVTGVLLLAFKLTGTPFAFYWYIVVGIGSAVAGCVAAFFIFRPTDKKVATRLDDEYGLDERVQTSLEYEGQEGTILALQRADTETRLNTLPKRKPSFSRMWQFLVTAVVSVAIIVVALVIPGKQVQGNEDPDPDSAPAQITDWHIASLQNIINDVNKSSLTDDLKAELTYEAEPKGILIELLDVLEDGVENGITQGALNDALYSTIEDVDALLNGVSTYLEVGPALTAGGMTLLGNAVFSGGESYKIDTILAYVDAEAFNSNKVQTVKSTIEEDVAKLRATIDTENADGILDALFNIYIPIMNIVPNTGNGLNNALLNFAIDLIGIEEEEYVKYNFADEEDVKAFNEVVDKTFNDFTNTLSVELAEQAYDGAMRRFICNQIRIIFGLEGIEGAELDLGEEPLPEDEDKKDTEQTPPEIGSTPGKGEQQFASDDEVYDPNTGTYRKYTELLEEYEAILDELVRSGSLTAEQAAMAREYFKLLYG